MPISRIKTDGIQDDAITSAKIGDTNVATADIANSSVTSAKIASGAVTSAKLDTNIAITGDLTVDTNTLNVDSSSNTVGIRNTSSQSIQASNGRPGLVVGDTSGARGISILSSATGAGSLLFVNSTSGAGTYRGYIEYDHGGNTINTYINSSVHAQRIHSNGVISVPQGIALGAGAANTAANVLDDYEEGDFTPTLSPGSGSYNGLTLTGKYTKVGRLVSVQMNLTITASGNAGGGATVGNLPFASVGSWNRMPNKWRENAATGACGQFTMNHGQTTGFMQNDDGSNIAHTTGRVYLINAMYYSA